MFAHILQHQTSVKVENISGSISFPLLLKPNQLLSTFVCFQTEKMSSYPMKGKETRSNDLMFHFSPHFFSTFFFLSVSFMFDKIHLLRRSSVQPGGHMQLVALQALWRRWCWLKLKGKSWGGGGGVGVLMDGEQSEKDHPLVFATVARSSVFSRIDHKPLPINSLSLKTCELSEVP